MLNKNVRIEVVGANLVGLMQDIQLSGIVADFKRTSDTALEIKTTKDNLPLLFAILQKKCYTYKVFEARGINKSYFIGASIGVAIFFIFVLVLMQFCFGIRVVSTDESVSRQVQEVVNSSGVIGQPWSKIDCAKLEQQVLEQIESISMVSIFKKGMCLVINTTIGTPKPNESEVIDTSSGLYADRDGVVSRIFVANGTALVKVGDTVSFGDMLVAPYNLDSEGEEVPVAVQADVYLYTWDSSTVEFCENGTEYARTGEYVVSQQITFWGKVLYNSSPVIPYEHYEVERHTKSLSSVLPIWVETIYYYQTSAVNVYRNFEAEKEALIYEAKQNVLKNIDENSVLEQKHTINHIGDKYYITYYIKTENKVG